MLYPLMNSTKWDELRLAMYEVDPAPRWSTLSDNGQTSSPDREWYYHFQTGGYKDIVYVDIFADDARHRERILGAIKRVHLPGKEMDFGFRIYGYAEQGEIPDYL